MFKDIHKQYQGSYFCTSVVEDWCQRNAVKKCLAILDAVPAVCADMDARSAEVREALAYAVELDSGNRPFAKRFWKALGEGDSVTRPQIVQAELDAIKRRIEPMTRHWDPT